VSAGSARQRAAADRAKAPAPAAEKAPQDSRVSSLRARLLALPYHYEDEHGLICNATPLGKVDG
jgi:hypothetical protein